MQNPSSTDLELEKKNDNLTNKLGLNRGLSMVPANKSLVNNQRNILAQNYRRTAINDEIITLDHDDDDALFILPNLNELSEDIRIRVMNNLVDKRIMKSLEETQRLNWWIDEKFSYPKLYSLITSGDGNCLLHAVSIAMWGFHDHALSMRKALNDTLITLKQNNSLYRRWRWVQSIKNKQCDLIFSEQEWNDEWKNLLRLSSIEPHVSQKKNPDITKSSRFKKYYYSLEEFHVYVLANNIRRPIIIYSDTLLRANNGEAISPIEFGGIYLPLEMPPDKCHKQPIFLAFHDAHFSALVPMEPNDIYQIPLIDIETLDLLPIHFFVDPGLNFQWPIDTELSDEKIHLHTNYGNNQMDILEKYLNILKKYTSLQCIFPSLTTIQDDQSSSTTTLTDKDLSNENNKIFSRSTLKNFRKKIVGPFSTTKRTSSKQQQLQNLTIPDEIPMQYKKSSPLLDRHGNILTIILTNFQPKRTKTSDDMMKNFIKTCTNEDNTKESNPQNGNAQPTLYFRHHSSVKTTQNCEKNNESDEEELLSIKNQQSSTKSNDQHHSREPHINGISNKSSPKQKVITSAYGRQQSSNSDKSSNRYS